jgi:hypothetical protein
MTDDRRLSLARLLVSRLERLSADSIWAHRASGLRGSILRSVELLESTSSPNPSDMAAMDALLDHGFEVLRKAAQEIEVPKEN